MLLEHRAPAPHNAPVRNLVAEANHRICNSLSAIAGMVQERIVSLEDGAAPMPADELRKLLTEVRARVDAVARFHRALADLPADAAIDVSQYLQQIAAELVATLSRPGGMTLHFAGELGCRAAPDRTLCVGLVVVEIVINALKYAHPTGVPGRIDMRCWRTAHALVVEIADDGVGFPDGFEPARTPTRGLVLVQSLINQIGGTIALKSDGLGLTCTISAPVLRLA